MRPSLFLGLLLGVAGCPSFSEPAGEGEKGSGDLPNGNFEMPGPACGPGWSPNQSTIERSAASHSGQSACKVCVAGGMARELIASQDFPKGQLGGAQYELSAFMRVESPEGGSFEGLVHAVVSNDAGYVATKGGSVIIDGTWRRVQAVFTIEPGLWISTVDVAAITGPGGCVLVDDVTLTRF